MPDSCAIVREVLANDAAYPTVAAKAKRLGVHRKTVTRMLVRVQAGESPVSTPDRPFPNRSPTSEKLTKKRRKLVLSLFRENETRGDP